MILLNILLRLEMVLQNMSYKLRLQSFIKTNYEMSIKPGITVVLCKLDAQRDIDTQSLINAGVELPECPDILVCPQLTLINVMCIDDLFLKEQFFQTNETTKNLTKLIEGAKLLGIKHTSVSKISVDAIANMYKFFPLNYLSIEKRVMSLLAIHKCMNEDVLVNSTIESFYTKTAVEFEGKVIYEEEDNDIINTALDCIYLTLNKLIEQKKITKEIDSDKVVYIVKENYEKDN